MCRRLRSWRGFGPLKDNFDHRSVESLDDVPYTIPNILVDFSLVNTPIPIGFWRSVGASQNGFFLESFADEMATAGKKDPYEFRRHLLAKSPRHLAVLETAAQNAGWGKPLPAGRARGIAVVTSYNGFVALVIEVSVNREERKLKVHRVVCALDCGRIVNPSSIQAQARSCIVYGLTAAQHSAITIDRGRVQQNNFNDYQMMRFDEMPEVEVHIASSDGPPTGAGEFVVPPVAPALCNAIFAATGKRSSAPAGAAGRFGVDLWPNCMFAGIANLPIGVLPRANQEIGDPRFAPLQFS